MRLKTRLAALGATAAVVATGAVIAAPAASASTAPTSGTQVLNDGDRFDSNWYDFDIVANLIGYVRANTDSSTVDLLADGDVALTGFLPNDRAFQVLVADLTKQWPATERDAFRAVRGLGVQTVENVLLYHVVPGATIDSAAALQSDGAVLATALPGATFEVDVISKWLPLVQLKDNDPDDVNPFLVKSKLDINKGNPQIFHGISFVLRPANL